VTDLCLGRARRLLEKLTASAESGEAIESAPRIEHTLDSIKRLPPSW
jgi:hypothetical protein